MLILDEVSMISAEMFQVGGGAVLQHAPLFPFLRTKPLYVCVFYRCWRR